MRRYVFGLAILALAVLGPSVARAGDQEIAQQIIHKLKAEQQAGALKGFSIDLQVEEGTVWMSGRVANSEQQWKALDIARRIPGVVQVVNDLSVSAPAPAAPAAATASTSRTKQVFANMTGALSNALRRQEQVVKPVAATEEVAPQPQAEKIGSAVAQAIGSGVANPAPTQVTAAEPVAQPAQIAALPYQAVQAPPPGYYGQGPLPYAQPMPVYAGPRSQMPLAYAPARAVSHNGDVTGVPGAPVPMHMPGSGVGIAPARYDHPQMPGYAWPSYAAHPNYAAVTYPKQYSPTAWPYIGPFYPYPQVPLGWRKVTLEWDDGWWMLDFKDRRTMYNH